MTAPGHRDDCECEECWPLVYVSSPAAKLESFPLEPLPFTIPYSEAELTRIGLGFDPALSVSYHPECLSIEQALGTDDKTLADCVSRFPITEFMGVFPGVPIAGESPTCIGCGAPVRLGEHDCGRCPI